MRWEDGRRSDNVEDQRGMGGGFGGAGGFPLVRLLTLLLGRRGGKYSLLIVAALMGASYLGIDLGPLTGMAPTVSPSAQQKSYQPSAAEQRLADFVSVVLADTEDTWQQLFSQRGDHYRQPKLVLFSGQVRSACGFAQAAMGPFYCPSDQKVYIDLSFYDDLKHRHDAPGDFAQAYVIAHEVGHHVQTLLGISAQVHKARERLSTSEANKLSVRQELQADCFAGLWAHHADKARQILEQGDVEEALNAAAAIGDDRLQKQAQGYVTPDSFTHGSSEQRIRWFKTGLRKGDLQSCNTFKVERL
jgi:predicted metalloprotease